MQATMLAVWLGFSALAEAPVDEFVPYTDGRFGGCYQTSSGQLYGCTRAPRKIDETQVAPEETAPAADSDLSDADAREELRRVRLELEDLKQRVAVEEARRASERLERDSASAAVNAAEQRDLDAAMAAYNAIESAKDSQNLKRLQEKNDACRGKLEAKGYTVLGPGACKSPSGVYENCPDC